MEVIARILLDIFIIYAAAVVAGELMERFHQPAVVGELLVGMLIGPYALGLIGSPSAGLIDLFHSEAAAANALQIVYDVLAELGIIMLLFFVGLETQLSSLLKVGGRAARVTVGGVFATFALSFGVLILLGWPGLEAAFVGLALVATSAGITARVLADLGYLRSVEARIILAAAVLDDILGMLLLAVASGLASPTGVSIASVLVLSLEAVTFLVFVLLVGIQVIRRFSIHLEKLHIAEAPYVVAILVTLGLATLSSYIGLAAIIGAFMAGMVFAETQEQLALEDQARPVYALLVPFFFVITGSRVDWHVFLDPAVAGAAVAITALAVAGKLAGCGLGAWGAGWRSMLIVGTGMVPRGEVALIVAGVARSANIFSEQVFSIIVVTCVITTLIVPPALAGLYRAKQPPEPKGPEGTNVLGEGQREDAETELAPPHS